MWGTVRSKGLKQAKCWVDSKVALTAATPESEAGVCVDPPRQHLGNLLADPRYRCPNIAATNVLMGNVRGAKIS